MARSASSHLNAHLIDIRIIVETVFSWRLLLPDLHDIRHVFCIIVRLYSHVLKDWSFIFMLITESVADFYEYSRVNEKIIPHIDTPSRTSSCPAPPCWSDPSPRHLRESHRAAQRGSSQSYWQQYLNLEIVKLWYRPPKSVFPDHLLQFFTELGQNVDSLIRDKRQENRTFSVHLLLVLLEYHHVEIPWKYEFELMNWWI